MIVSNLTRNSLPSSLSAGIQLNMSVANDIVDTALASPRSQNPDWWIHFHDLIHAFKLDSSPGQVEQNYRDSLLNSSLGQMLNELMLLSDSLSGDSTALLLGASVISGSASNNPQEVIIKDSYNAIVGYFQSCFEKEKVQLSLTEISALELLALECPFVYGQGVLGARALLMANDGQKRLFVNACELPIQNGAGNRIGGEQEGFVWDGFGDWGMEEDQVYFEHEKASHVNKSIPTRVFPNPFTNQISIETNAMETGQWVCAENFPVLVQCTNANFDSYLWSNGVSDSLMILVPTAGIYWLEANYACGNKRDTIAIKTAPSAYLNLGADTTLCIGLPLQLSAPDSMQYYWSNGSTDKTIVVDSTAIITLLVVDQYGCSSNDQIQIFYEQPYHQILPNDTTLLEGTTLSIELPNNLSNVLWSDGSTNLHRDIAEAGLYVVQASDENNCLLSDSILVNFVAKTPQLPGLIMSGDFLVVRHLPQGAQIIVYDAHGQIIYREENYNNQWQPRLSQAVYFVNLYLAGGEELRGKVLVMD